jgi:transcriptional regulator with XRE-family HTH domain/tetratricopeptide (TPR) repeat protein
MEEKKPNTLLRRERELKGWSQKALAARVGTNEQSVNHWESGLHKPSKYFQAQLCQLYGKSAEELGFMHKPEMTNEKKEGALTSPSAPILLAADPQDETRAPFSQAITQGTIDAVRELEGAIDLDTSRRRLLQQTLPLFFGVSGILSGTSAIDLLPSLDEKLSFYSTAIPSCWTLVYNGGIAYVEKVLPTYLAHLTTITQQSSRDRKLAASLTSQGYKLANLLDLRHEDFGAALRHSNDAFLYGQMAEDPNLQVAALIEEALTFQYRKRFPQTLASYQKAFQVANCANRVSPIIKGRVYGGLAFACARLGQEQEALRYMGLAYETFPEHPENDSQFSYTHYSHYYLYLYEGLMYTGLSQTENALAAYTHLHGAEYGSRRIEIANKEAASLLIAGDLDRCSDKVEAAATLALSTKSDLRYSEASEIYQGMCMKWPHEPKAKGLAQIFQQ